jgi:S-adenosylmethionine:tRNA ribosyltransferase-isomerase
LGVIYVNEIEDKYRLSSYDFELGLDRIAPFPVGERPKSKLLVLDRKDGSITDSIFENIGDFLRKGDLLIFNDTKVIKARLYGKRETGGAIEVFLVRPSSVTEKSYELNDKTWDVLINPARSLKAGQSLVLSDARIKIIERKDDGLFIVQIDLKNDKIPLLDYIQKFGTVPVPPYVIRRRMLNDCAGKIFDDDLRYQTVYAKREGSVAAPTAGFHFEEKYLAELSELGIKKCFVTLHVGLGTFKPIKSEDIREHGMEKEWFNLSEAAIEEINSAKRDKRRVIAVGTTSVRVLESAFKDGVSRKSGWTDLFIYPGFEFKAVDAMITNFHLPQSSLLLLVSALAGRDKIRDAYRHAVENGYRFFSYGDAMFIK